MPTMDADDSDDDGNPFATRKGGRHADTKSVKSAASNPFGPSKEANGNPFGPKRGSAYKN